MIVSKRPYVVTFRATGTSYPLSSEEVARLAAEYPRQRANGNLLILRGDDGRSVEIRPATRGGGVAFSDFQTPGVTVS